MASLLERLKQRKLFQWTLAYLAAAWLLFQGIEVLAEPWNLSEMLQRVIHVLLGIGFVVTLILAWYHGEKGRQRASGVELLILAGILVIAGAAVAALWRGPRGEAASEPPEVSSKVVSEKSIAVLPFANLSADPENEYFSDGITETIIAHLSKIADLKVISRTSVMQYKRTDKSLPEIAAELGVATILEGSVQRAGDRVQITAQLIDAESDEHLWAEQYNRQLSDIFAIQSEVALNISLYLAAALSAEEEQQIQRIPTENFEAYNLYLLGRHWLVRRSNFEAAIDYFEGAIEKDSTFALAYVGLADSYRVLAYWEGWDRADALQRGKTAAREALAIDNTLGEAYTSLAAFDHWMEWKWEEAKRNYERAIALSPGYAEAHKWYGQLLNHMGNLETGRREIQRALELDPLSPIINLDLGTVFTSLGRYDDAIRRYQRVIELAPGFSGARKFLGSVYLQQGLYEEALQEFQPWSGMMTAAYSGLGMHDRAQVVLEESKEKTLWDQLEAHLGMGQIDDAFEVLDELVEQRHLYLPENIAIKLPYYSALHSDPRFNEVLKRMGLPER